MVLFLSQKVFDQKKSLFLKKIWRKLVLEKFAGIKDILQTVWSVASKSKMYKSWTYSYLGF